MKLLSIAIPTYNRCEKLVKLLNFLYEEMVGFDSSFQESIEVLVCNNCSTDNTEEVIKNIIDSNDYPFLLRYHCNEKNVGLLGNLLTVTRLAEGRYLWMMGDDDLYHNGIVSMVYEKVRSLQYSYIFINHTTFRLKVGDGLNSMLDGIDVHRVDSEVILDILNNNFGAPMFMSAEVYEAKYIREFIANKMPINICLPLGFSLYSASKGNVGIIPEAMIDDDCGNVSWTDVMKQVDLFFKPVYFKMAISLPFKKSKSIKIFISYIYKKRKMYFRYFFIEPIKKCLVSNM